MRHYRFAVLGNPVEHSRSPELHRAMLARSGLQGDYLRIPADEEILRGAVDELRRGLWDGLNVTMPLKGVAARVVDSLSPTAERAGSVNTLLMSDSRAHGESTDAVAFNELFMSDRFALLGAIHVLGAGGGAAAALAALPDDRPVYVAARRKGQAEHLSERLGGDVVPWGAGVAGSLVINTTPLGMSGESLPGAILDIAAGLIDLPYGVEPTPATREAAARGIPHADGHEFLIRQAMASFTMWTGVELDYEALKDASRNV